jgi:phenylalanyl-tRNA synthetase alpha chain
MDLSTWRYEESIANFREALARAGDADSLAELRNTYLSKKRGLVGQLLKALREAPAELKPKLGKEINIFKKEVEAAFKDAAPKQKARRATMDLTLPGIQPEVGGLHPLTLMRREMLNFFVKIGYDVAEGPEIENDFYNFEALNTPADHPAREDADTFYIDGSDDRLMLRTQTSGCQIRYMEQHRPPFRMVAPGKVYRRDDDVTHSPMFQQLEGLVVGERITFCDLKGTLEAFARHMFGDQTDVRLRPSFFPFTEPSAELDVTCPFCSDGCRVCKQTRWIELLGCGMVDPNVFKAVGYDPETTTGFAFGMGIERFAMIKYTVPDIRYFYHNDRRFLDRF